MLYSKSWCKGTKINPKSLLLSLFSLLQMLQRADLLQICCIINVMALLRNLQQSDYEWLKEILGMQQTTEKKFKIIWNKLFLILTLPCENAPRSLKRYQYGASINI